MIWKDGTEEVGLESGIVEVMASIGLVLSVAGSDGSSAAVVLLTVFLALVTVVVLRFRTFEIVGTVTVCVISVKVVRFSVSNSVELIDGSELVGILSVVVG